MNPGITFQQKSTGPLIPISPCPPERTCGTCRFGGNERTSSEAKLTAKGKKNSSLGKLQNCFA